MKIKMRNIIAVCSILAVISSCGRKSQENVLENSDNLLSLQMEVVGNDTLMGVRTIFDTIQVVPMDRWDSIKAQSPQVVKAYRDGSIYAYTATGKKLGNALKNVLTITTSSADSTTFYRGVADQSVFYFPQSDQIIEGITEMYIGRTVALFQTDNGWAIRKYDGSLIWQTKDKDICILKRIYADVETINIVEPNETNVWVYDIQGNVTSRLTAAEWQKAKQSFRRETKIGEATYGELDINYAL